MRTYGQLIKEAVSHEGIADNVRRGHPPPKVLGRTFHPVDLTQVVCCFNFTALPLELQLLTIEFLRFVDLKLLE